MEMKQRVLHLSSLLRESAVMTLPSRHCYWANQSFWVQQEWNEFGSPKDGPPEMGLLLDHSSPGWPLSFLSCLPHPSSRDTEPSFLKEDEFCLSEKPRWNHSSYQATKSSAFFLILNIIWNILFGADYSAKSRSPLIRIYWWRLIKLLPPACNKALWAACWFFLTLWSFVGGLEKGIRLFQYMLSKHRVRIYSDLHQLLNIWSEILKNFWRLE